MRKFLIELSIVGTQSYFYMDLFSDVAQVLGTDSTKEKNSECFY